MKEFTLGTASGGVTTCLCVGAMMAPYGDRQDTYHTLDRGAATYTLPIAVQPGVDSVYVHIDALHLCTGKPDRI